MKFFNWFLSIFQSSKSEAKQLASDNYQEFIPVKKDRNPEIISASQDYIKKVHELCKLSKNTIYHEKFLTVMQKTQEIHDRIVNDPKVPNTRLEQFHMYFTHEFIDTFTEALDDLIPKKPIALDLKSDFKLREELEIERINTERENVIKNISAMSINDKIDIIIKNINSSHKLVKMKEFDDVCETDNGKSTTFGDKYTSYLYSTFSNLKDLAPRGKFIGDLNDKEESPIIFDSLNNDLFKVVFKPKNIIEKLGNIGDENIKSILMKSFPANKEKIFSQKQKAY